MSTPDAFDALRADTSPIAPSVSFADQLRQQLAVHLHDTTLDNDATTTPLEQPMSEPATVNSVTPYLVVDGAAAAIAFYVAAFGAVEHHRLVGEDGRVITIMSQGDFVSYTWPELISRVKEQAKATFDINPSIFAALGAGIFIVLILIIALIASKL